MAENYIDIVFDGPPDNESGRFVEVENEAGEGINAGGWIERDDGYWVLRITQASVPTDDEREPQGEPSDTRVYEAETAFWAHKERTGVFKGAMRAALRAAGEVKR